MVWNASPIVWDAQVTVLLILLPPVFVAAALLAFSAPRLVAAKLTGTRDGKESIPSHSHAVPNSR